MVHNLLIWFLYIVYQNVIFCCNNIISWSRFRIFNCTLNCGGAIIWWSYCCLHCTRGHTPLWFYFFHQFWNISKLFLLQYSWCVPLLGLLSEFPCINDVTFFVLCLFTVYMCIVHSTECMPDRTDFWKRTFISIVIGRYIPTEKQLVSEHMLGLHYEMTPTALCACT